MYILFVWVAVLIVGTCLIYAIRYLVTCLMQRIRGSTKKSSEIEAVSDGSLLSSDRPATSLLTPNHIELQPLGMNGPVRPMAEIVTTKDLPQVSQDTRKVPESIEPLLNLPTTAIQIWNSPRSDTAAVEVHRSPIEQSYREAMRVRGPLRAPDIDLRSYREAIERKRREFFEAC